MANIIIEALRDKWGDRCQYCGRPLIFDAPFSSLDEATTDHIQAQDAGGKDTWDNLILCCRSCNSRKGPRSLEYFRYLLFRAQEGIPYFSEEQFAWLARQGFEVPTAEGFLFYFERKELEG